MYKTVETIMHVKGTQQNTKFLLITLKEIQCQYLSFAVQTTQYVSPLQFAHLLKKTPVCVYRAAMQSSLRADFQVL